MSRRLRYSNPQIVSHLASHYVLGQQTEHVRRQTDRLRQLYPELDKAILDWQTHFNQLDELVPPIEPPTQLWQNIEQGLFGADVSKSASTAPLITKTPWYQIPYVWLGMSLSSAVTAVLMLALLMPLLSTPDTGKSRSIGYLAVMSATESPASPALTQQGIDFVLTAYKGQQAGESTLHVQWNSDFAKVDTSEWVLTSVEKGSGLVTNLGKMKSVLNRHLTSSEWKAIKNSQSLQIKRGDQVIFEGPCLQLTDWIKREAS